MVGSTTNDELQKHFDDLFFSSFASAIFVSNQSGPDDVSCIFLELPHLFGCQNIKLTLQLRLKSIRYEWLLLVYIRVKGGWLKYWFWMGAFLYIKYTEHLWSRFITFIPEILILCLRSVSYFRNLYLIMLSFISYVRLFLYVFANDIRRLCV